MRRSLDEQQMALACLNLAQGNVSAARAMLAFVEGRDEADAIARLGDVEALVRGYATKAPIKG